MSVPRAAHAVALAPPADREWDDQFRKTAWATFHADSKVTLHNVRDWTYAADAVVSKAWRDITVDTAAITGMSFMLEPFPPPPLGGHTFLSFEFKGASSLSFSIEAKLKADEPYSLVRGALGAFGLSYLWGTERDFVTRRILYLGNPLRRYPVNREPKFAQALFCDLAEETNALARRPRRYNTLTANCTNLLAVIVNRHAPNTLPWDLSWHLPGLSDTYLMRQGLIAPESRSIADARAAHDLATYREQIAAIAQDSSDVFSGRLKQLVGQGAGA